MANKQPKLTMAQVYTLRRIASGTRYSLRGDGKKGIENRPDFGNRRGFVYRTTTPINAPSIPVLFRLGLIKFNIDRGQEPTNFYYVGLTDTGHMIIKLTEGRTE